MEGLAPRVSELDDDRPRTRPSRAQKKRAVEMYEVLARELVEMTASQYAQVGVPEVLREQMSRWLADEAARTSVHQPER